MGTIKILRNEGQRGRNEKRRSSGGTADDGRKQQKLRKLRQFRRKRFRMLWMKRQKKVAKLEQQAADNLDKYQRTLAEFDNFRKRTIKKKP